MKESLFRDRLGAEYRARREKNPRYSLRAFAAFLGTDHSTLSQVLRGSRRPPVTHMGDWAEKLGMSVEETAVYIAAEHVPDEATTERQEQLRHWTAEAIGMLTGRAHREILRLSREPAFRADCRWIAKQIGVGVDEVNMALSRLLRLGLLEASAKGKWKDLTGLPQLNEPEFRKLALSRVREKAVEHNPRVRRRGAK
jgi:transcriptional regulator with XRE-family HTH domain